MKTYRLIHVKVISAGLIVGGISAVVTLFVALLALPFSGFGHSSNAFGLVGLAAVFVVPLFQGLMGFLQGVVGALVFNFVADMLGGLELGFQGELSGNLGDYEDSIA